jgi:hypothetical protein
MEKRRGPVMSVGIGRERRGGGGECLCLVALVFRSILLSEEGVGGPNIVSTVQRKGEHM